jgi:hypothetical protein
MTVDPTCPRHGHRLDVIEEATLSDGVLEQWWGACPGEPRDGVICDFHVSHPFDHPQSPRICDCRAALAATCGYAIKTHTRPDAETSLFDLPPDARGTATHG